MQCRFAITHQCLLTSQNGARPSVDTLLTANFYFLLSQFFLQLLLIFLLNNILQNGWRDPVKSRDTLSVNLDERFRKTEFLTEWDLIRANLGNRVRRTTTNWLMMTTNWRSHCFITKEVFMIPRNNNIHGITNYRACHPGGNNWDYYHGNLSVSQVSGTAYIPSMDVYFIYGCSSSTGVRSLMSPWGHNNLVPCHLITICVHYTVECDYNAV